MAGVGWEGAGKVSYSDDGESCIPLRTQAASSSLRWGEGEGHMQNWSQKIQA